MKTVRLMTLVILLAVVFSVWTPAPVLAKQADTSSSASVVLSPDTAGVTIVNLTINNRTGGTLWVSMTGEAGSYSFAATNQGKTKVQIKPGKYVVTLTSSACSGSLTLRRTYKSKSGTIGPISCRK